MKGFKKILLFFSIVNFAFSQFTAGTYSNIEPRYTIDLPTAGVLKEKMFAVDFDFFSGGGVLVSVDAGALENFNLGISIGGERIIGSGKVDFQKYPAIKMKYRFLDEKKSQPAVAIGFDLQGRGSWIDSLERFEIKSRGIFLTASRNYSYYGNLSLHFGANYSFEKKDHDISPNLFFGLEKSLGTASSFLLEYDFALNDDAEKSLGSNFGYLNSGIRTSFGNGFTIEIDYKDIFLNRKNSTLGYRAMKIEFVNSF